MRLEAGAELNKCGGCGDADHYREHAPPLVLACENLGPHGLRTKFRFGGGPIGGMYGVLRGDLE